MNKLNLCLFILAISAYVQIFAMVPRHLRVGLMQNQPAEALTQATKILKTTSDLQRELEKIKNRSVEIIHHLKHGRTKEANRAIDKAQEATENTSMLADFLRNKVGKTKIAVDKLHHGHKNHLASMQMPPPLPLKVKEDIMSEKELEMPELTPIE